MRVDIQALNNLIQPGQDNRAVFGSILTLLKDSPDSSIIANCLSQINPDHIACSTLRQNAYELLIKSEAPILAQKWVADSAEKYADNVIPLNGSGKAIPINTTTHISFEDVGGLENVKKQFRRKIISPFQEKKEIFKKFRRKAGGGVLMYGPPGCGKTMISHALATECKANFKEIKAADILDRYVGNAEKHIVDIFKTARTQKPTVLFFDEIEALAQKRQFDSNSSVNTVVSALLNEMDGFADDNEGVLLLGATNVPWSVDTAFRRPGRFDRTIFVPPPDRIARAFILKRLLLYRPVAANLSVDDIVGKTSGYSGADLTALVETAIDYAIEDSPSMDDLALLSQGHFNEALREVKSSVGEWLSQANGFASYANKNGLYDDLTSFLKRHRK